MNFYTNVQVLGNNIAVRAIEDGNRIKYRDDFNPSLFIPDRNNENEFKTLDGVSVAQVKPGLIKDCREFIDKYNDVENFSVYGYDDWVNQYIGKYFDRCDYDASEVRV